MHITSTHRPDSDATIGERSNFKKIPTHTQDHGDDIATRGESVRLRTLVDRKRKRYDNTVDVVVRLHDPTDQSSQDGIELNVCRTWRCRAFGTWIGRIVKTYDYINRVVLTLPLSVYEGMWTHSPLSLLCITMIMSVRRKILELLRSPT